MILDNRLLSSSQLRRWAHARYRENWESLKIYVATPRARIGQNLRIIKHLASPSTKILKIS